MFEASKFISETISAPELSALINPKTEWEPQLRQAAAEAVMAHNASLLSVSIDELQDRFVTGQERWFAKRISNLFQYAYLERQRRRNPFGEVEVVISPDYPLDILIARHRGGRVCMAASVTSDPWDFDSLTDGPRVKGIHIADKPLDLHPTVLYFDLDGTLRPSEQQNDRHNTYYPIESKINDLLSYVKEAQYDLRGWTYGNYRAFEYWRDHRDVPFNEIIDRGDYFSVLTSNNESEYYQRVLKYNNEHTEDIRNLVFDYLVSLVGSQPDMDKVFEYVAQRLDAINWRLMHCRVPEMRASINKYSKKPEYTDEQLELRDPFLQNSLTVIDDPYFPGTIALGGNTIKAPFRAIEKLPQVLLQLKAGQQIGRMRAG